MTSIAHTQNKSQLGVAGVSLPMIRNRSRLVAGLIAITFSCLLASVVYGDLNNRSEVLVLSHSVEQGHIISTSDLTTSEVSLAANVRSLAPGQRSTLIGQKASTRLEAGTMLSPDLVDPVNQMTIGTATAAALMKPGQYPASMKVGDRVRLITPAPSTAPIDGFTPPLIDGSVTSIDRASEASGAASVSFIIPEQFANAVASSGATGSLAAVVLPQ